MIIYIIKSGLCLALILLVYKIVLERERMYTFNRYYLLFGLCFALIVPFITMETTVKIPFTESATAANFEALDTAGITDVDTKNAQEATTIAPWIIATISLYAIGYLLFFFRFIRNIYRIFYKIIKSVRVRYREASLVLLKENVLPHTFLHYIFLKKEAYDTQNIAEELYTHELAHVSQKHSLDIIFIELIQIVFWFNPLFIYYKKAIQLNHEFLADDAVLKSNTKIPAYQHLLLKNADRNHNLHLASNLNFSVTKKRLQMMTKHTTRVRAWLTATLTIPVFIGALFLFSTKVIAKEITKSQKTSDTEILITETQDPKADYYKNATFIFEDSKGNKVTKNYAQLTTEEKALLVPPPPKPSVKNPTKKQLNDWGNNSEFAIWIDGKVVNNEAISNNSIVYYTQSFVYNNARSKRFPQPYQVQLYTKSGFNAMVKDFGSPLSKNAVLHFKKGKHSNNIFIKNKKVGSNVQNNLRHELAKANKLSINYVDKKNGPNEMEAPYTEGVQKQVKQKDIELLINKNEQFLVNDDYVCKLKSLDKFVKIELKKIQKKSHTTASIRYDKAVSEKVVNDAVAILKKNHIYDITISNSNSDESVRLPPPPPAPEKIKAVKVSGPDQKNAKAVNFMHKIMKGEKVNNIMINGKKHFSVVKNGRTFIFNEDSKLVDKNGKLLPPPPAKKKTKSKK